MRYLFLFVLTLSSFAGEAWEVKQANNFFTLEKDNISYPIVSDGGSPQFIKEKEFNKTFSALIYKSGEVGSQKIIIMERALLFKDGKYVEDVPYRNYEKGSDENIDIEWKISEDSLEIIDNADNKKWKF